MLKSLITGSTLVLMSTAMVGTAYAENYGPYPVTVKGYKGDKKNSVSYTGQVARHVLSDSIKKLAGKSDGKGRSEKSETGQEAKANGAGKRRGLLGRNRRGGKAENNKSQEAKAETPRETRAKETKAKENKPQNSGGKKPNKKGDAFEGNMPDFLK